MTGAAVPAPVSVDVPCQGLQHAKDTRPAVGKDPRVAVKVRSRHRAKAPQGTLPASSLPRTRQKQGAVPGTPHTLRAAAERAGTLASEIQARVPVTRHTASQVTGHPAPAHAASALAAIADREACPSRPAPVPVTLPSELHWERTGPSTHCAATRCGHFPSWCPRHSQSGQWLPHRLTHPY